ncbi:MAG: (d)CMP kinase [Chlamydiae bacterium]|nr:MAG: (d)CMP kinase [Chlamydiota bacterium]
MIIAIDGTVASGKSTVAKKLAEKIGYFYINTGLMYRGVAAFARINNIPTNDSDKIANLVVKLKLDLKDVNGKQHIFVNDEDLTEFAIVPDIGSYVSNVADNPEVRKLLVSEQRRLGLEAGDAVLEGRDIGSDVFPDADIKFYVTADSRERAHRRLADDQKKNPDLTIDDVEKAILDRDKRDKERPIGALKKMSDSIEIDTTNLSIDEVVDLLIRLWSTEIKSAKCVSNLKAGF